MDEEKRKRLRKTLCAAAACVAVCVGLGAGTLALLCNAAFQRHWVENALRERGIDAHFDALRFGVIFSDEIAVRGATLKFPDGSVVRLDSFFARHNGVRGLFDGLPSFRDLSCRGLELDDARGRRRLEISCSADEIGAAFPPTETIGRYMRGNAFPFSLRTKNFRVKSARGREIASGDASASFSGAEPLEFSGKIRGNFAELLAQPIFSKIDNVAAGTFELTGQGRAARLALRDLRSRCGNIEIPVLNFSAERGEGSAGTLTAEIFGEEKTSAEIRFSRLEFEDGRLVFFGETDADTVVVADVLRAGLLFRGWSVPAAVAEPPQPAESAAPLPAVPARRSSDAKIPPEKSAAEGTPPSSPSAEKSSVAEDFSPAPAFEPKRAFWHGVSGKMDFRARRVIFPRNEFGAHQGTFSVSENRIEMNCAVPEFFGGAGEGRVALDFSQDSPNYRFSGNLRGNAVQIHEIVPALRAREPKPLEGKFDFESSISAAADEPEFLENSLEMRFVLESAGAGRVRIFDADSKKMKLVGDIVRVSGDLAKMLGGLTRNLEPRASRLAESVGVLKNCLTDFPYSKMRAVGEYRAGGDILCREIEIFGESLRFGGNGSTRPLAGKPPERWPVKFAAHAAARGEAAAALRELGLLRGAGTPDADGFVPARDFEFAGCAADFSEKFFETLMDAASGRDVKNPRPSGVPAETILDVLM